MIELKATSDYEETRWGIARAKEATNAVFAHSTAENISESLNRCLAAYNELHEYRCTAPGNKPMTVEQLMQMDGEPVWIQRGKHGKWRVIKENLRDCIYFTDSGPTGLKFSDYGETWLAYDKKPVSK